MVRCIFHLFLEKSTKMDVNKDQFRHLIEEGKIGAAINQISDIMHFLGDTSLMTQLEEASDKFNEYEEAEEAGNAPEGGLDAIKSALLAIVDQLPESFTPDGGEGTGSGGCMGVLLVLISLGLTAWLIF